MILCVSSEGHTVNGVASLTLPQHYNGEPLTTYLSPQCLDAPPDPTYSTTACLPNSKPFNVAHYAIHDRYPQDVLSPDMPRPSVTATAASMVPARPPIMTLSAASASYVGWLEDELSPAHHTLQVSRHHSTTRHHPYDFVLERPYLRQRSRPRLETSHDLALSGFQRFQSIPLMALPSFDHLSSPSFDVGSPTESIPELHENGRGPPRGFDFPFADQSRGSSVPDQVSQQPLYLISDPGVYYASPPLHPLHHDYLSPPGLAEVTSFGRPAHEHSSEKALDQHLGPQHNLLEFDAAAFPPANVSQNIQYHIPLPDEHSTLPESARSSWINETTTIPYRLPAVHSHQISADNTFPNPRSPAWHPPPSSSPRIASSSEKIPLLNRSQIASYRHTSSTPSHSKPHAFDEILPTALVPPHLISVGEKYLKPGDNQLPLSQSPSRSIPDGCIGSDSPTVNIPHSPSMPTAISQPQESSHKVQHHPTTASPASAPGIAPYSPSTFKHSMAQHAFTSKTAAIEFIRSVSVKFGFSVLVRTSKPDYVVVICNCGRRLKRLQGERKRNRRFKTALTGCEWRIVLFRTPSHGWEFRSTPKMQHNHSLPVADATGDEVE